MAYRNGEPGRRQVPALDDPQPVAASSLWRAVAQAAIIGIFGILFIAAIDLARPILLPTVSAFVVTMTLSPLSERAEELRIPPLLTAVVLWLLAAAVFYCLIVMVSAPVVEWIGKAPEIGRNVQGKLHVLDQPLAALRDLRNVLLPADATNAVGFDIMSIVKPAVSLVTPAIGQLFVFFAALLFMLLGRDWLRRALVVLSDDRDARLRMLHILNDVERNLAAYLSVVAMINFAVGIAAGLIAWLSGLPDPFAWAMLGFILNFIPYLGPLIMEAAMLLVGLVTFPTLAHALVPPLLYVAMATLEGHFITPSIIGMRLTLNPLVVFLSLVFWTWLWGPIGAFLAVPVLIVGLVAVGRLFPRPGVPLPD
ncbi:MAG: AI-2E family transporter [Pseudolabrys sp.]